MTGLRMFSTLSATCLTMFFAAALASGQATSGAPSPATATPAQPASQPAQVASPGVQPEAARILEAATKALADANSLTFKAVTTMPKFQGAGMDVQANFQGTVEMLRRADGTPGWMTRREGTANMGGATPYLVVSDGQVVSWIDHDKQTVFEKYTRSARDKQITAADSAWIKQLTDAQPFAKELAAPKATLEGTATADGTPCDIVAVNFGDNKAVMRWFFGAADHLPRRLETAVGPFQTVYEITDLKVNPDLSPDRFTLPTPDGYKREAVVKPAAHAGANADNPPILPPKARPTPGDEDATPALRAAPAFELKSTDGKTVSLQSLKGNVAVLGFWGSWHRGGRLAAPELQALADHYKGKPVKIYWLALKGKDDQGVRDFLKDTGLTVGALTDADAVAKDYQVRSFPGFVVVGFDGEVLHQTGGFVAKETMAGIEKAIDKYLAGGGPDADAPNPAPPGTANTPGGPRKPLGVMPATVQPSTPAKPANTQPKPANPQPK